jgi:hypothetical protein
VCLRAEADWFDVQISEAFVLRVADKFLRLDGHKLRVEPRSEHLTVEGLVPAVVVVLVGILEFDGGGIGFDLGYVEEHFVNFLVGVGVGASQIVRLSDCLLHFEAVHDSKRYIGDIDGLYQRIHSFNLPVHSVEHFHLHAPFGGDRRILVQKVHDVSWSHDGHIREDGFDFLFSDPLCA